MLVYYNLGDTLFLYIVVVAIVYNARWETWNRL